MRTGLAALLAVVALVVMPTAARAAPARPALAAGTQCNFNDPITIRATWNGKYVSTEKDYTGSNAGMLRARADAVGPWEIYYLCWKDGWAWNEYAFLSAANNKFVTAEFDYQGSNDGMLRARADDPDVWERFAWNYGINGSQLQSTWTGQYVSAEHDYTGSRKSMLRARAGVAGVWEQFVITWM
ncbi:fascin domain-containing protein [Actinoplanes sp. NPDC049681]|uniref:fascin domain-containing protein n=1 Tax=Actinoplanes sp. NPDC049681 TaxID=3363905 RepID=UPI00378A1030